MYETTSNLKRTTIGNVTVTTIRQTLGYMNFTWLTQIIGGKDDGRTTQAWELVDAYTDHEQAVARARKSR